MCYLPLVAHICRSESHQHWFRYWLAPYSATSHYLNQYWFIVNWTLRNKHQCNLNKNTKLLFTKMHLKISSAKYRPFCPGGDELNVSIIYRFNILWSIAQNVRLIMSTLNNIFGKIYGQHTCPCIPIQVCLGVFQMFWNFQWLRFMCDISSYFYILLP